MAVMEMLWPSVLLLALGSTRSVHSHPSTQGLSCVNDFVSRVSCVWNGSRLHPDEDCWISGWRKVFIRGSSTLFVQRCKLEQLKDSLPGCSLFFKNKTFTFMDIMPNISIKCSGVLMDHIEEYCPNENIQMNPPGVPNISTYENETLIMWDKGSPISQFITKLNFQVQITQDQSTPRVNVLYRNQPELRIPAGRFKGNCEVRVRVNTIDRTNSQWSHWSPAASWVARDRDKASSDSLMMAAMFGSAPVLVVLIILYIGCVNKWPFKGKPVPNPSEYFQTLHSVHKGNLKKWLNPLSASTPFFTAQAIEKISAVEVCDSWDTDPSTFPPSTSTKVSLHCQRCPSAGSNTSGIMECSSSDSSFFYNMGYFVSGSSDGLARIDPNPAYFTYPDDIHDPCNTDRPHLALQLCPSFTIHPTYESLRKEPQSPDSGFCIGKEEEEEISNRDEQHVLVEKDKVSNHKGSSLLRPPPHPPVQMFPTPSPPSPAQMFSESQPVDQPVAPGSSLAWPVAGNMYRSSSMPVESTKSGYFVLKDLQTTFSNESI